MQTHTLRILFHPLTAAVRKAVLSDRICHTGIQRKKHKDTGPEASAHTYFHLRGLMLLTLGLTSHPASITAGPMSVIHQSCREICKCVCVCVCRSVYVCVCNAYVFTC